MHRSGEKGKLPYCSESIGGSNRWGLPTYPNPGSIGRRLPIRWVEMGSSKWREASVRDLRTHLRRHGRNTKLYLEKAEMVAEAERIDRLNKATAQWNAEDVEAWLVGLGADPALFQQYEIQGKDLQTLQEKEIRSMVTRSNTPEMVNKVVEEWKELKRRDDQASTPKNVQSHEKKGKKKALLVGCLYRGTRSQLQGCVNDNKYIQYMLVQRYEYHPSNIMMLNDHQQDPQYLPTKRNILNACTWLLRDSQPGDRLFFQFSGHGSKERDYSGAELDGYNETILPIDFKRAGMISDDTLHDYLVKPLRKGVALHALADSCHSGTVLDLPYITEPDHNNFFMWKYAAARYKAGGGGDAVLFSSSRDNQTSADTSSFTGGIAATGAMTYCFIKAVESKKANTYGELLVSMYSTLRRAAAGQQMAPSQGGFGMFSFLLSGGMGGQAFNQCPQMSSTEMFDLMKRLQL